MIAYMTGMQTNTQTEGTKMDRQTAATAIAKIFAYLACGKPDQARIWAAKLISWLETI